MTTGAVLAAVAAILLGGEAQARALHVDAEPLSLAGSWAAHSPLTPIAAFRLRSSDDDFGGLSGIVLEGDRARLVGDRGMWVELRLTRDARGRIVDVAGVQIDALRAGDGGPLGGSSRDAESAAQAPGGRVWVGFERLHRVVGYPAFGAPAAEEASQLPHDGLGWNQGVEALAIAPDGALIAIAEEPPENQSAGADALMGWRMIAGRAEPFRIARVAGYAATGADIGPDGALYLLERRFGLLSGVWCRIRRFPDIAARLATGGRVGGSDDVVDLGAGETLIALNHAAPIDNMEAIAVEPSASGDLLITIVADDNFSLLQKTVLLQFAYRRGAD